MSNFTQLIEQLSSLTVAESAQLISDLEALWGVKAPRAGQATFQVQTTNVSTGKEQTEFEVVLATVGAKKVQVIKVVREILGLPLKEAKDLVDAAPRTLKESVSKSEADAIKAKIEAEGGTVELK